MDMINNCRVYDVFNSIRASGYPMKAHYDDEVAEKEWMSTRFREGHMGKHGMKGRVWNDPDPTFSKVLGIFRKEARKAKEAQKAADAFACLKAVSGKKEGEEDG